MKFAILLGSSGSCILSLLGGLLLGGCVDVQPETRKLPTEPFLEVQSFLFEGAELSKVQFLVKNGFDQPICLPEALFIKERTLTLDLLVKRDTGELVEPNPVGYIAELPVGVVILHPQEMKSTELGVTGYYSALERSHMLAKIQIFGWHCDLPSKYILRPEFILESGWHSLSEELQ